MARLVIVPKFTPADIKRVLMQKKGVLEQVIISRFQFIGENFVKNARENGNYQDQTGNLRNSIGYLILKDGEQLFSNFRKSARVKSVITKGKNKGKEKTTSGSADGLKRGQEFASEVAKKFPKGFVLICVAGMEYAAAVESKGKDVLTSSSITADADLRKAITQLSMKIGKLK